MNKKKRRNTKNDKKIIRVCFFICLLCIIGIIFYYMSSAKESPVTVKDKNERKLQIVDTKSSQRPLAVMYDNNVGYQSHAGLQDSYLNYEIIVEGGLTRIMALFKDREVALIGPVRSSRHYFLDYALESDTIYCHYGWSEFAKNDISLLGVDNINGLTANDAYWRDKTIAQPHNVFTDTNTLYNDAKSKNYDLISTDWQLLSYNIDEIFLQERDKTAVTSHQVDIRYSSYQTTSYSYDSENKYYLRFMDGNPHLDKVTKNQLHYKNIIVQKVENSTIDSYGRQDLETTGTGEGYYITNGYALPITWTKLSRKGKTKYTYLDGSEVKMNDGNTFIQIIPTNLEIGFS